jgi:hypothetical protein
MFLQNVGIYLQVHTALPGLIFRLLIKKINSCLRPNLGISIHYTRPGYVCSGHGGILVASNHTVVLISNF